jgi:hypothetical protein
MALAIDGSSPAAVTSLTATVTTASFTPPANSKLLISWAGDSSPGTNPAAPSITDNLGAHLTYVSRPWQSRVDAPGADGQAAMWTADVATSAAMTVSVTNGAGVFSAALKVWVLTDSSGGIPGVGATGKSGSLSAASIAQSYTAQATGGQGFIVANDGSTLGNMTAGTGCTVDATGTVGTNNSYGFGRRTTADDSNGGSNTLNITLAGTSAALSWVYVEITPVPSGAADSPDSPRLATRPSGWQGPPFLIAPWRQLLPVTDPGPAPINPIQPLVVSTSTPAAVTKTLLSSNPAAPAVVSAAATPQPVVAGPAFTWPAVRPAQTFAAPQATPVVTATVTPTALIVSPPFTPVPVPGANISASQPLGNPAVGTPGPAVVGPQFRWPLPTPAIITAGPVQPGAPRALVVTPPWTPVYIPPVSITASQPLGNPAVATPPAIVVTPPPWRLTTQPQLFGPGAPTAVVSTTATPNALVVTPTFAWPLVPLNFTSSSQPLGNPAVGTPQPLIVSTPWSAKVPGAIITGNPAAPVVSTTGTPGPLVVTPPPPVVLVPGARLFAGAFTTTSPQPLVVSTAFLRLPVPGARISSNPLVPPAQRTFAPVLVVTTPWVSDRGGVLLSRGTEPGAAVADCHLPRPDIGDQVRPGTGVTTRPTGTTTRPVTATTARTTATAARPGTGTTARPTGTTTRPGSGATTRTTGTTSRTTGTTSRPDTGDTDNPC